MIHVRHAIVGLCVATASAGLWAQSADDHKDHHPAETSGPATVQGARPALPAKTAVPDNMADMDRQMQVMQTMHQKLSAAKTPEDRQALMAEHMKTMQDGMRMMESVRGQMTMGSQQQGVPTMQCDPQMMDKRMDMMQSMMQMMMDRMPMSQGALPGSN